MSVDTEPVPRISADDQLVIDDLVYADDGIIHVTIRAGYMLPPDVPAALHRLDPTVTEGPVSIGDASYFLSRVGLRVGNAPTMARWRKRLSVATSHLTADAAEHYGLPLDRTVTVESQIDI